MEFAEEPPLYFVDLITLLGQAFANRYEPLDQQVQFHP